MTLDDDSDEEINLIDCDNSDYVAHLFCALTVSVNLWVSVWVSNWHKLYYYFIKLLNCLAAYIILGGGSIVVADLGMCQLRRGPMEGARQELIPDREIPAGQFGSEIVRQIISEPQGLTSGLRTGRRLHGIFFALEKICSQGKIRQYDARLAHE